MYACSADAYTVMLGVNNSKETKLAFAHQQCSTLSYSTITFAPVEERL